MKTYRHLKISSVPLKEPPISFNIVLICKEVTKRPLLDMYAKPWHVTFESWEVFEWRLWRFSCISLIWRDNRSANHSPFKPNTRMKNKLCGFVSIGIFLLLINSAPTESRISRKLKTFNQQTFLSCKESLKPAWSNVSYLKHHVLERKVKRDGMGGKTLALMAEKYVHPWCIVGKFNYWELFDSLEQLKTVDYLTLIILLPKFERQIWQFAHCFLSFYSWIKTWAQEFIRCLFNLQYLTRLFIPGVFVRIYARVSDILVSLISHVPELMSLSVVICCVILTLSRMSS